MSGRKANLKAWQAVSNAAMTSNITSPVSNVEFLDNCAYEFIWTGSPTGTFSVQVSIDYNQDNNGNVTNSGNWSTVPVTYWNGTAFVTGLTVPTSVGSPVYIDLNQMSAPWIRAAYTFASGSGTLSIWTTAKMI
jgi:hypothetical protein